ncbi:REP-associated tyrosine transposase [Aureibacter tunicatorum]|uniref:REP element-mobilizing transposase RayT n=1 Tax=Aureibacter tunicatorum TaxID=866807 RepID=A0AAE4BVW1_9BACT|nr:transposase [Aureibacter tunicatorum]MDR6242098.1 REP element-mobilizing transposase RayT [Aureibacter tunicatorum]
MSRKYKVRDQSKLYFITFTVVHWVDVFTRAEYKDIFISSLQYCQVNKGLEVYAYVIMSNHVHLIVGASGLNKLEEIIRDLKKYTSKRIIKAIEANLKESRKEWMLSIFEKAGKNNCNNKNFQFWKQDYHPIEVSNNKIMDQKLEYIHENPVKAGLVTTAECYLYSSASNYYGLNGLLEIKFIE